MPSLPDSHLNCGCSLSLTQSQNTMTLSLFSTFSFQILGFLFRPGYGSNLIITPQNLANNLIVSYFKKASHFKVKLCVPFQCPFQGNSNMSCSANPRYLGDHLFFLSSLPGDCFFSCSFQHNLLGNNIKIHLENSHELKLHLLMTTYKMEK